MSCECGCLNIKVTLEDETINIPLEFGEPIEHIVAPETYTGPTTVTPTETEQTLLTKDKLLTDNVTVNPIPSEYVDAKADYDNALTAFGVESGLADGITALTTYSNSVTGEQDENLSDAVRSLADGFGGGGSFEYEEGTYTPATDELPTITFANSHSKAPDIIIFADVSAQASATGNTLTSFTYVNVFAIFGNPLPYTASVSWAEFYAYTRIASNLNGASGAALYIRDNVTASGFEPFAGTTSFICRQGQTFKWIAIWM